MRFARFGSAIGLLAAVLVAGAGGMSCADPSTRGELMVVVQTDMSLPKDIDKLRIEIVSNSTIRFGVGYSKLGADDAIKVPATIGALVNNEAPKTPVYVRVMAWQGEKIRMYRETITTVPETRLAMLRMPVQWLCDGQAQNTSDEPKNPFAEVQDGKYDIKSTCAEGMTCVAGSCVSSTIDSADLPDYSEDKAFGGGTGAGDGVCFDTSECFIGGTVAALDADCTFASDSDVNVAIMAEGDGICGPAGCFVPLDAKSDSGWTRSKSDAGRIQLPQVVCAKINNVEGTVGAKAVGVAFSKVTDNCKLKTEDIPTCGPWSSTGTTGTTPDDTIPVALASGQDHPVSLVGDGFNIYWTSSGTFGTADGSVKYVGIQGGVPITLASAQASPRGLAITTSDVSTLFWTNGGTTGADGAVFSMDLPQGTPVPLQQNQPSPEGIAVLNGSVYFTAFGAGAVYGFATATPGTLITLAAPQSQAYPFRIAVDKTNAFWTNEGTATSVPPDGSVSFGPLAGGNAASVASGVATPRNLAVDVDHNGNATAIFWTSFANQGEVLMVPVTNGVPSTGAPIKIAVGQSYPNGIAVDDDFVYWTNRGEGTLRHAPKTATSTDAPLKALAPGQNAPGAIYVDSVNVYWVNEGASNSPNGSIMKVKKPAK